MCGQVKNALGVFPVLIAVLFSPRAGNFIKSPRISVCWQSFTQLVAQSGRQAMPYGVSAMITVQ